MKIYNYYQFLNENSKSRKAAIITGEGFQDEELYKPKTLLEESGFQVVVLGTEIKEVKSYNSETTVKIERLVSEANPDEFEILILPGGKAPETLRQNQDVLNFVKEFYNTGKPIAAICHGPQILISSGLTDGKNMTCYSDMKDELIDSGANYFDESFVKDGQILTSRNPNDLEAFNNGILQVLGV